MKSRFILVLALLLTLALCACTTASPLAVQTPSAENPSAPYEPDPTPPVTPEPEHPAVIRVAALKGPTAIGMVQMIDDANKRDSMIGPIFEVVTTDEIVPMIAKGEIDLAAVPANLAATLYNNTSGAVRVLAINTLGVTYIVDTGTEINAVEDLRGKTIYAQGKGTVLEYTLRHILQQNGIDPDTDVTLEFKNEPTEIVATLKQLGGIAMLSQPFVTTAMDNVEGLREALDLTAEWDKLDGSGSFITGVLIGRTEFIDQYPSAVEAFLEQYEASVDWVNTNPAEAAPLVEEIGVAAAAVAERAIPKCHVTFISGSEMKTMLSAYLNVLFESNPASVGGALPGDDFYVTANP